MLRSYELPYGGQRRRTDPQLLKISRSRSATKTLRQGPPHHVDKQENKWMRSTHVSQRSIWVDLIGKIHIQSPKNGTAKLRHLMFPWTRILFHTYHLAQEMVSTC